MKYFSSHQIFLQLKKMINYLNFGKNICAQDTSQMPIATALFVATCLGTPAIALTGLKLGMFAAVGGGIMGFATGKMFAEHE